MSGREGHDFAADPNKVFCFAGKNDRALFVVSVIEWPDADGIAGGNKLLFLRIVQDQGKFSIQHPEHFYAVLFVEGQQDLTVRIALELVAFLFEFAFQLLKAVDLSVAYHEASVQFKRLHSFRMQAHNGQPMKAQQASAGVNDFAVIRTAGNPILMSDLGLNPTNDGKIIRLVFPELTEERRKELAKDVKKKGENAKVAVRNIRRDAIDHIKKAGKAEAWAEDEIKDLEDGIQKLTDKYVANVDKAVEVKTKEILTV